MGDGDAEAQGGAPVSDSPSKALKALMDHYGVSQAYIATHAGVSPAYVSDIVKGRRSVSPRMAVALSRMWRSTKASYWLHLQADHDLATYLASQRKGTRP